MQLQILQFNSSQRASPRSRSSISSSPVLSRQLLSATKASMAFTLLYEKEGCSSLPALGPSSFRTLTSPTAQPSKEEFFSSMSSSQSKSPTPTSRPTMPLSVQASSICQEAPLLRSPTPLFFVIQPKTEA